MASATSIGVHEPAGLSFAVAEHLLPPNPSPELYSWELFSDENGEDELFSTETCVIWSRGGEVGRCLRFDVEKEPVLKALLAYFPADEGPTDKTDKTDKIHKIHKTPPKLAKTLIVFLRTQAHVFSFSRGDYVVHMPFEVETALAAPRGVIIQRKAKRDSTVPVTLTFPRAPPNSFLSSQILPPSSDRANALPSFSTAGLGTPRPLPLHRSATLEHMWDAPLETSDPGWPRLIFLADPMLPIGLIVTQPDKGRAAGPAAASAVPFLDPAEEILHVEAIPHERSGSDELVLAVTVNRETSMYSVWRLAYLDNGDQLTARRKRPKTKPARRRSSMQPGLQSGAVTPRHPSFRESLGGTLPVKKTRKTEAAPPPPPPPPAADKADTSIETALNLGPDRATEASRRQSRRVSSLLARADLSASHERPSFTESSLLSAGLGRRADSHGSQRARSSAGPAGAGLAYSQTLNSLLEAPADGLLEELRSGGDFEGLHTLGNMGLDDTDYDGLRKEMMATKIHSVPMDAANLRYSLSTMPANQLSKVFIVAGTPYSVDEQDRNYLLVCIQDAIDTRLQLLTLHVQTRRTPTAHGEDRSTSITWGQLRRAQNVADSCKIYDGDQTMILILSEGADGQHQLSIQAPWSELTTIVLPPLRLANRDSALADGSVDVFPSTQPDPRRPRISGLQHPRPKGVVDLVDQDGRFHQIQIKMEPRTARVRQILNVLRSVLPAAYAEKIVAGWWHIMQWLASEASEASDQTEWTGLVVELYMLFLALLDPDGARFGTGQTAPPETLALPPWALSKSWDWALTDDGPARPKHNKGPSGAAAASRTLQLTRAYMASALGSQAVGPAGYLPTAQGLPEGTRKRAAWGMMMALHLFLEDEKLDSLACSNDAMGAGNLTAVLWQIAHWLGWETFAERYALDLQGLSDPGRPGGGARMPALLPEPDSVPCLSEWILARTIGRNVAAFPLLSDVHAALVQPDGRDGGREAQRWASVTPRTLLFRRFLDTTPADATSVQVVEAMERCGFTAAVLDALPEGVAAPLRDAISRCQAEPPAHWSAGLYELVGRGDINTMLRETAPKAAQYAMQAAAATSSGHEEDEAGEQAEEPESAERLAVIQALFSEDKRLYEAQGLLTSAKARVVQLEAQPEWSEPEYLERQKELVTRVATSTLATPAGRGMLQYGFRFPLLTQTFAVQGFNLTCVVRPGNVAVGVDKGQFTEDKVNWAFFHQGVAYGLAISPRATGIDTSWIMFNRAGPELSHRHAGFLLALGLNGHLRTVAKWVAFKYLTPKHVMTSIGLLLGLAVSHLGTMDSLITRLLSVHVTRMLPAGAAELNLSHQVQTTGLMGLGLVYSGSGHRRMSEIMLSELEHDGDEEEEDPLRNEGYRLAAGFALGLINLGRGRERRGLAELAETETLLRLATATKRVEAVNVLDRSAAAATVALALIFVRTEDAAVARKIDVPTTAAQFDYVRPDVLLLRTLARQLVQWSGIGGTFAWVRASLPAVFRARYRLDDVEALRSGDLPFFAILAGLCWAAALRYAGSGNTRVRDLLVHYLDGFWRITTLGALTFDAHTARAGARMGLNVLALAAATVMAGSGDVVVLRRLRALHGRDDVHTPYGSHMAAHMAVGTLFLGSGTTTLGTSNRAVAALLIAFYPLFPATVQDNGAHLQAFRHFWVLATEPRCLVAKDLATGQPVRVPLIVHLRETALSRAGGDGGGSATVLRRHTPCLLPPLDDILAVRTDAAAAGYWDLALDFGRADVRAAFAAHQTLCLRRRPPPPRPFVTTLQVLGGGGRNVAAADTPDALAWLFALGRFQGVALADRADLLGPRGAADGSRLRSHPIDVRLVLEGRLARWTRDGLLDVRQLFAWAAQRERLRRGDRKRAQGENSSKGESERQLVRGGWWLDDGLLDALKGRTWVVGQSDEEARGWQ